MDIRVSIVKLFLTYTNDYITVEKFAEDHGLRVDHALALISIGRVLHEENVTFYNETGRFLYEPK